MVSGHLIQQESTYIVVDGPVVPSSSEEVVILEGEGGEGDQVRVVLTVFSNSYISARFFSNSIVESTFLCFNKCPVFQQQSNRELNKCSGGGRGVDIASLRHLHHPP